MVKNSCIIIVNSLNELLIGKKFLLSDPLLVSQMLLIKKILNLQQTYAVVFMTFIEV